MAEIKSLGFSSSEPGTRDLRIALDLTLTSIAGAVISAYSAFGETFSEAPKVVGVNIATTGVIPSAKTSTTGITLYAYQPSTDAPDATVELEAYVKGKLA